MVDEDWQPPVPVVDKSKFKGKFIIANRGPICVRWMLRQATTTSFFWELEPCVHLWRMPGGWSEASGYAMYSLPQPPRAEARTDGRWKQLNIADYASARGSKGQRHLDNGSALTLQAC